MSKIEICEQCGERIGMLHCSHCGINLCHKCLFTDKCKGCFTDSIENLVLGEEEQQSWENILTVFKH
jgi:hypothetical protein